MLPGEFPLFWEIVPVNVQTQAEAGAFGWNRSCLAAKSHQELQRQARQPPKFKQHLNKMHQMSFLSNCNPFLQNPMTHWNPCPPRLTQAQ